MTTTTESAPVADTQANEATTEPVANDDGANKDPATTTGPASPAKKEPKPNVHKTDFVTDVVYLYQFPRSPTIPSLSGYCLKVETFLRVTGIKYENVDNRYRKYKSKKGQLPFIELNGEEIPDSDVIIRELSKRFDKDLNAGLTAEQRNQSHAFESMLNNHTAWVVRWWRYSRPEEFLAVSQLDIKKSLNSRLPRPVLNLMFKWGLKRNMSAAVGHGIGHHSPSEAVDFGKGDLKALSDFLGNKDYFFGKEIRQLDVTAFAHLAQFVYVPFEGIKEWIETETPNLLAFCNRIKDKYWPDWEEMGKTLEINTHLPKPELTPEQLEEQKKAEEKKAEEKKKGEKGASATDSADDQTQGNKPSRSSTSFRLPAFVPLIRSRVSSSTPSATPEEKEEKKRQKEEEKRKKQEEKERKKKEAEEAKAKAKAEAEAAKAAAAESKASGEAAAAATTAAKSEEAKESTKESTEAKEETTEAEKKE